MAKKEISQYEVMTRTPVSRLVLQLGIPTTISMLVTSIYNLVDTAFVGSLGTSASGAVGVVFGFMAILQAVGFMFGQGCGSMTSRLLGQKDVDAASKIASTGFFLAVGSGFIIQLVCWPLLTPLARLLGSTETILPYAKDYLRFILAAAPCMLGSYSLNCILRYEGRANLAMIGLLTGSILNIGGDYLLIYVAHMGISGAALSTALSQIISFCILLSMFLRGRTQCKLSVRLISRKISDTANIVATGAPSLLRQGLGSLSTITLNTQAGLFGDAAVAAMSISSRVGMFFFSICLGIGQGYQPVCAFNYGANKADRVKKAYTFTLLFSECFLILFAAAGFILAPHLIALFRDDPAVIDIGIRALRLFCIGLVFLPLSSLTEMTYQSTGKKLVASLLSMLRGGLYMIPLLFILSTFRGLSGIQEAQPLAYVLSGLTASVFAIRFFRNYSDDSI